MFHQRQEKTRVQLVQSAYMQPDNGFYRRNHVAEG